MLSRTRSLSLPALISLALLLGACTWPQTAIDPDGTIYKVTEEDPPPDEVETGEADIGKKGEKLALAQHHLDPSRLVTGTTQDKDTYLGVCRKKAKISFPDLSTKKYATIKAFIEDRPNDDAMRAKNISTDADSGRVDDEKQIARITCWILASNRPDDNDYHVIVGNHPTNPTRCINVEISGLPEFPRDNSFTTKKMATRLKTVRTRYKNGMGSLLPGQKYKLYEPGIPVYVTGAAFYDRCHAVGRVGPTKYRDKLTTCWELHPVTWVYFR